MNTANELNHCTPVNEECTGCKHNKLHPNEDVTHTCTPAKEWREDLENILHDADIGIRETARLTTVFTLFINNLLDTERAHLVEMLTKLKEFRMVEIIDPDTTASRAQENGFDQALDQAVTILRK